MCEGIFISTFDRVLFNSVFCPDSSIFADCKGGNVILNDSDIFWILSIYIFEYLLSQRSNLSVNRYLPCFIQKVYIKCFFNVGYTSLSSIEYFIAGLLESEILSVFCSTVIICVCDNLFCSSKISSILIEMFD